MSDRIFETGQGRVWLQKFGPRPDQAYAMLSCAKMAGFSKPSGDITRVQCPDPAAYGSFLDVAEIQGAADYPTTSLQTRFSTINYILRLPCEFDLQTLYGLCKSPGDRVRGWEKAIHFYRSRFTTRSSEDLTALQNDENNPILLTGEVTARGLYEIDPMTYAAFGASSVVTTVLGVAVCDAVSCGGCQTVSEGGQKIYAVQAAPGAGSPGVLPSLVYSKDGGGSWTMEYIDGLGATEQPTGVACVGDYVVVISNASCSIYYADAATLGTWAEAATGFVAAKCPNAIHSRDASHTWIVGDGGYVYFTSDPTAGVSVQSAGAATTQNLNAVHFADADNGVAVGANNAVIYTNDAGATWAAVTGPVPGQNLLSVWAVSADIWFVGADNSGRLYYTLDGGTTWVEKTTGMSGTAGDITDIKFTSDPAVGFFSARLADSTGRIYRTIDGGYSWYRAPEASGGTIPANTGINALATVAGEANVNTLWAGGSAAGGDGVLIRGIGY